MAEQRDDEQGTAPPALDTQQQRALLQLAREALTHAVKRGKILDKRVDDPALNADCGVFCSLHAGEQLRGCVGTIEGGQPLYLSVIEMTLGAANRDSRFPPVRPDELRNVAIELTVLHPRRRIAGPDELEVGRHGILVVRGRHRGILLPQVATQYGWNARTFLEYGCQKAGLEPDAWTDPDTELYVFEAQVFGEAG
jgi:AmmeMemoRadiSam system protein A